MTFDDMVQRHGSWLSAGLGEGPVISSRIRLARNLEEYSFPGWASEEEKRIIWGDIAPIFEAVDDPFVRLSMSDISTLDKEILFERHLGSGETTFEIFVDRQLRAGHLSF